MVLRICRSLLSQAEAEDAWSETFLSALRAYPDLSVDSNVAGWLSTIAYRKSIDQLREPRRSEVPVDGVAEVSREDPAGDGIDPILRDALLTLPPKQQGAVIHRYLADLSYAEVALHLECTQAAARRSAADGIAAIRSILQKGLS